MSHPVTPHSSGLVVRTFIIGTVTTLLIGGFGALWLLWSLLLQDATIALVVALIAIATLLPLLGAVGAPAERHRHG